MAESGVRLILVRHGNTFEKGQVCTQVGAKSDLPLTEAGREQARAMGDYLKREGIEPTAFLSGALCRQTEAVRIIADCLGASDKVTEGIAAFTEIDYGAWEALSTDEITERWPREYQDWKEAAIWPKDIFGGELSSQLDSVKACVEQIRTDFSPGETVLAVGSNGSIRYFYSMLEGPWQTLVRERRIEELKVRTGNFCELSISSDDIQVVCWNRSPSAIEVS